MILDEEIKRYFDNAEYERTHGNLQGCLEFRQLAKLLKELKAYRKICHKEHVDAFDKARAEIADLADSDAYGDYQQGFKFGLMRAAQIIDKYRTESEDEE